MIEQVANVEQFLYHYTTADTAINYILKSRRLRFGAYTNTNDPKEAKTWQFDLGTNENRNLGAYKMTETSAWLSNLLKDRARLLCFSMDRAPLTGVHIRDIFNRGFSKPRMWTQYAGRHTGVCLVFDRARITSAISRQISGSNRVLAGAVEYIDRPVLGSSDANWQFMINIDALEDLGAERYAELNLERAHKRLFFEKMTDWRDECEWRWVAFVSSDQDLYVAYGDALIGVMFGEETSETSIQDMMDMTESWGLRYMGLRWKNCSPWYDYGNLRYTPGIKDSPWGKTIKRI